MTMDVHEAKLTLHGLVQHYIKLSELEKNCKLNDFLDALDFNQVVIFVKSEERLTYKSFKEGHKRILVAIDLVGRGIDIELVNIVINYDMLDFADTYLHRVGRTGRFGTAPAITNTALHVRENFMSEEGGSLVGGGLVCVGGAWQGTSLNHGLVGGYSLVGGGMVRVRGA
eukprot:Gb_11648 [translate_table: standard]